MIGPDCGAPTCNAFDGDGYSAEDNCGTPVDCDDNDMAVNPRVAEDCTDGVDNDCDGAIDPADPDRDTGDSAETCVDRRAIRKPLRVHGGKILVPLQALFIAWVRWFTQRDGTHGRP